MKAITVLLVAWSFFANCQIYLSNVSNVCTAPEYYEVHTNSVVVYKPTAAFFEVAWLSLADNTAPFSFADSVQIYESGTYQFYSLEVEKYFIIDFRLTGIPEFQNLQQSKILLYENREFNIYKFKK